MKFIIATHNQKKLLELRRILSPLGMEVLTAEEAGINFDDVEETGTTFEENAQIKALALFDGSGFGTIADDSGLCVDALDGAPGIYSARYSGEHGNDAENIELLLKNMADVPDSERTARFVCAVCCVMPDGKQFTVRGECEGKIGYECLGDGGFGYDPIFMLSDGRSMAQLSKDEKDAISHRGNALEKLVERLEF
ncbi:MAG: RdgB/HAM1 family non-canonical purine NTP pyrophosphatase [Clostridia bacterium]|nr:RdgB/HAM1 family non-canonical purine NTP pyrophosphatase [Clostridia bacterium]